MLITLWTSILGFLNAYRCIIDWIIKYIIWNIFEITDILNIYSALKWIVFLFWIRRWQMNYFFITFHSQLFLYLISRFSTAIFRVAPFMLNSIVLILMTADFVYYPYEICLILYFTKTFFNSFIYTQKLHDTF